MERWMLLPMAFLGMILILGAFARLESLSVWPRRGRRDLKSPKEARILAKCFETLCSGHDTFAAGAWIRDNRFYLRQQAIRTARELNRRARQTYPVQNGEIRICMAAKRIAQEDTAFTRENLVRIMDHIQLKGILTFGELEALSAYVQLAYLKTIASIGMHMDRADTLRQKAFAQVRRMEKRRNICWEQSHRLTNPSENSEYISFLAEAMAEKEPSSLRQALAEYLQTKDILLEDLLLDAQRKQARMEQKLQHAMEGMRFWSELAYESWLPQVSKTEQMLLQEPGCYAQMDENGKAAYRRQIQHLASRWGVREYWLCRQALRCACDGNAQSHEVGYFLLERQGVDQLAHRLRRIARHESPAARMLVWQGSSIALAMAASAGLFFALGNGWVSLIMLPVFYDFFRSQVEKTMMRLLPGRTLLGLELKNGIPHQGKTCVVIPALVSNSQMADRLLCRLESFYCANREKEAVFVLLADLPNEKEPDEEAERSILQAGFAAAQRLNCSHGTQRFFFLPRKRRLHEGQWSGWERKRGALAMLNRLIVHGECGDFICQPSTSAYLSDCKFVLTLDADSVLMPGSLRALAGVLLHPLNTPVYRQGKVVQGYGLAEPRLVIPATNCAENAFTRWICHEGGLEPYISADYDFYQRIFGQGIFTGKGMYRVDAYDRVVEECLPENRLLSHDLLEGALLRTALVGQVSMLDGFPATAAEYLAREHRWIRGDWQLLPFMGKKVPTARGIRTQRLGTLPRLWMLDNLFRSGRPIWIAEVMLAAFVTGCAGWMLCFLLLLSMSKPFMTAVLQWQKGKDGLRSLKEGLQTLLWRISMAPMRLRISVDGILRTLWRVFLTHRGLLEWTTAAQTGERAGLGLGTWYLQHGECWGLACLLTGAGFFLPEKIPVFCMAGLAAATPGITWLMSRKRPKSTEIAWDPKLGMLAERTFCYFRNYLTEENHFLPPDHVQYVPKKRVAERTSPTNMGLAMASIAYAVPMGYLSMGQGLDLLEKMTESMGKLKRWRGHWYNWYDIRQMTVLQPFFISSVDSGNLLAGMMAAAALLKQMMEQGPDINKLCHGVADRLAKSDYREKWEVRLRTEPSWELLEEMERRLPAEEDVKALRQTLQGYCHEWHEDHWEEEILNRSAHLIARIEEYCREMDLTALYDGQRELFYIGIQENQRPAAHYDLYASEARLLSILAIAKGDVSAKHWQNLARSAADTENGISLWSWSGTMFEYLMPRLFLRSHTGTMSYGMEKAAVMNQLAQEAHGLWGISESGYDELDMSMQYQYYAFGVKNTAMRRDNMNRQVFAPYASLLALPYEKAAVMRNMDRLQRLGMLTDEGMMEAVEFRGKKASPVQSCMVHHQGMSFLALANALTGDFLPQTMEKIPMISGVLPLLEEKPLTEDDVVMRSLEQPAPLQTETKAQEKVWQGDQSLWPPQMRAFSNGHYHLYLNGVGGGYSKCEGIMMNRWLPEPLNTAWGWNFYLSNDHESRRLWPGLGQERSCVMGEGQAHFAVQGTDYRVEMQAFVDGQENAEIRTITITNESGTVRKYRLSCLMELVLQKQQDYLAHPAYQNLFIETESFADGTILTAKRRKKDPNEPGMACAMGIFSVTKGAVTWDTDRQRCLGQGGNSEEPLFLKEGLTQTAGAILDPAMAITKEVRIPAGEKVRIDFALSFAENVQEAKEALERLAKNSRISWAQAWERAATRYLQMKNGEKDLAQKILGFCVYPWPAQIGRGNTSDESSLWPFGIPLDQPMVVLHLSREDQLEQAMALQRALKWLHLHGVSCVMVFLLSEKDRYYSPMEHALQNRERAWAMQEDQLSLVQKQALRAHACLWLEGGSLLAPQMVTETATCPGRPSILPQACTAQKKSMALVKYGFDEDGNVVIEGRPPRPWSHMLTNGHMGALLTSEGGGYLWLDNAQMNRITPWWHDALRDRLGWEWVIKEKTDKRLYTPFARPWSGDAKRSVKLQVGCQEACAHYEQLHIRLQSWIPQKENCFYQRITLTNVGENILDLEVNHWMLWEGTMLFEEKAGGIQATKVSNHQSMLYRLSEPCNALSWDKTQILGLGNENQAPTWPFERGKTSGQSGDCCALRSRMRLLPGETKSLVMQCSAQGAVAISASAEQEPEKTVGQWENVFQNVQVETPDEDTNRLMNRWIPYQNMTYRFLGRTGYDQCGGAFGFRDQLQDCLALLWQDPQMVRKHILRAAAHQYEEGDVQHWWHEPNHGVRTRISDDRLFLPFAVRRYVEYTDDTEMMAEKVPYLVSAPLAEHEADRYEMPQTGKTGSLWEHCKKAVDRSLQAMGEHGLPLMGSGDWNDAMNQVGVHGQGESVWLGFFLYSVLGDMMWLAEKLEQEPNNLWKKQRRELSENLEKHGWDGSWYKRAFHDDGSVLGSRQSRYGKIDALPQAWAVLSEAAPKEKAYRAMSHAMEQLYDPATKTMALLQPPYEQDGSRVGYIQGYVPGIRENGGQYTHCALWMAAAWAKLKNGREAWRLWKSLLPTSHSEDIRYQAEPYLVAADIMTHPQNKGRAGWTGYTGSASWMFVTGLENILGIRRQGNELLLDPCINPEWPQYRVRLGYEGKFIEIEVRNPRRHSHGIAWIEVDGRRNLGEKIPLNPIPAHIVAEIK